MAIEDERDLHKELIRIIAIWDIPNHQDRHADINIINVIRFQRENGTVYDVIRCIEKKRSAALKAGGSGILHRIVAQRRMVDDQHEPNTPEEFRLYQDGIDWYIEHDMPQDTDWQKETFPAGNPCENPSEIEYYPDPEPTYLPDIDEDEGDLLIGFGRCEEDMSKRESSVRYPSKYYYKGVLYKQVLD